MWMNARVVPDLLVHTIDVKLKLFDNDSLKLNNFCLELPFTGI